MKNKLLEMWKSYIKKESKEAVLIPSKLVRKKL